MRADRRKSLRTAAALVVTAFLGLITFGPALPAEAAPAAAAPVAINGAGSTYAYPALQQWSTDEEAHGLSINFNPNGSAAGRQQYSVRQLQYAGTDIAYIQPQDDDPFGTPDLIANKAYSYIPDVAGGLSFMYNIQVRGHRITNMRLSGHTLAEIFTGHITNWDDPAITKDYGQKLPSTPITVVTRSDGAGESYFLTNWMLHGGYANLWVPFCEKSGGSASLCKNNPTEFYPSGHPGFHSLNGADNVTGYVSSSVNNGAIGYAEYYYALNSHLPVVSMENAAGYFVQPTAANVAIALEAAKIDENEGDLTFLMQTLNNVYTDKDPRTYPLSSYSYLVVPRISRNYQGQNYGYDKSIFSPGQGTTLSTFVGYMLCQAQGSATKLGYSPLPEAMVEGGFKQYDTIPDHVSNPAGQNPTRLSSYANCGNPAFLNGVDLIIKNAPQPSPCQKFGEPLGCTVKNGKPVSPNGPGGGSGPNGSGPNGSGPNGPGSGQNGSGGPGSGSSGSNAKINPNTGQVEAGSNGTADTNLVAAPVAGIAGNPAEQWAFGILAAILLVLAVAMPAGLGAWLAEAGGRRPRGGPGPRQPFPGVRPPANGPRPPADGPQPPDPGSSPSSAGPSNVNVNPPSQDGGSLT